MLDGRGSVYQTMHLMTIVAEKLVVDGLSIARTIFGSEGLKEIWQHDQCKCRLLWYRLAQESAQSFAGTRQI